MKFPVAVRALICAALLVGPLPAGRVFPLQPGERAVDNELLVRFRPGAAAVSIVAERIPGAAARRLSHRNLYKVQTPGRAAEAAMRRLAEHPLVDFVEPNRLRSVTIAAPDDTSYTTQWALARTRALEAWTLLPNRYLTAASAMAGDRVKVAVLDTGADCTHPDFMNAGGASVDSAQGGQIAAALSQASVSTNRSQPCAVWQDDHGHGTHVAGTIAAATGNGRGVSALGHPLELAIYKVLAADGYGDDGQIAAAIVAAADAGVRIISMSLGGDGYSQSLEDAVAYARQKDVLVVAATGNSNRDTFHHPAGAAFAFGVAAVDSAGARASFSNFGPAVDIAAPGVNILSTYPTYAARYTTVNYGNMSGTSMATPHVSALAGLLAMATPGLAPAANAAHIQRTAQSPNAGWEPYLGYGNLDAFAALSGAVRPASTGAIAGQIVGPDWLPVPASITVAGQTVTAGDTGIFRIAGIPGGMHQIRIAPAAGGAPVIIPAAVLPGADNNLVLQTGTPLGGIAGTVTDGRQEVVAGAAVQALDGDLVLAESLTDPTGRFHIAAAPGSYGIRVSAPGYRTTATAALAVVAGAVTTVNPVLPRFGAIAGTVVDNSGAPVANANIVVDGPVRAGAVTGAAGQYTTIGLPAGTYTVTASSPSNPSFTRTGIVVSDGDTAAASLTLGAVSLAVTPAGINLAQSGTQQFSAMLNGTPTTAVTWTRSPAAGTLSPTGLYTAPASLSGSQTITITATSTEFPARSATATIVLANHFTLSLGASSTAGGVQVKTNTITLDNPAPAAGATVSLASSSPAVTVPASVSIPAGAKSATFAIATSTVTAAVSAVVTATYDGVAKARTLAVRPPALYSVGLSPATLASGASGAGNKINLDGPATAGGLTVALQSANPEVVAVPATVTIPEGSTSAAFTTSARSVAQSTPVVLTATYAGISKTATVTVVPTSVTSVALSPATVVSGMTGTGNRVYLNGPAPAAGFAVALASSDPALARVPVSVTVAAGQTSAVFTTNAAAVAALGTATLSATGGGSTKTAVLTVRPAAVSQVALSPASITGGATSTANKVTLDGLAPAGGTAVTVSVSNTNAAAVPSPVVPAGTSSVLFAISTSPVSALTSVGISASAGGGTAKSATLAINPLQVSAVRVPPSLTGGAVWAYSSLTLNGAAPPSGAAVLLASSNPSVLTVPAGVTVPAGATLSPNFTLTSYPVSAATLVTISATYNGITKSATVNILPAVLSSVSLSPTSVKGGTATTVNRLNLTGVAAVATTVALASSNPAAARVPATVTVPAGASYVAFSVATSAVLSSTPVTITATQGGLAKTAVLTVVP